MVFDSRKGNKPSKKWKSVSGLFNLVELSGIEDLVSPELGTLVVNGRASKKVT